MKCDDSDEIIIIIIKVKSSQNSHIDSNDHIHRHIKWLSSIEWKRPILLFTIPSKLNEAVANFSGSIFWAFLDWSDYIYSRHMIYRTRKDNKKYVPAYKYKHNGVLHRYTLCRIIWLNNYLDNLNLTSLILVKSMMLFVFWRFHSTFMDKRRLMIDVRTVLIERNLVQYVPIYRRLLLMNVLSERQHNEMTNIRWLTSLSGRIE